MPSRAERAQGERSEPSTPSTWAGLLAEHLEAVRGVSGFTGSWEVAGEDWLAAHDVEPWMGPRSLPLWLPAESIGLNAHDTSRAVRLGLRTRPLAETLADTLAWELAETGERRDGLSDEDERELLSALDSRLSR